MATTMMRIRTTPLFSTIKEAGTSTKGKESSLVVSDSGRIIGSYSKPIEVNNVVLRALLRLTYPVRKPLSDYATSVATNTMTGMISGMMTGLFSGASNCKLNYFGNKTTFCLAALNGIFRAAVGGLSGCVVGNLEGAALILLGTLTGKNFKDAYTLDCSSLFTRYERTYQTACEMGATACQIISRMRTAETNGH